MTKLIYLVDKFDTVEKVDTVDNVNKVHNFIFMELL